MKSYTIMHARKDHVWITETDSYTQIKVESFLSRGEKDREIMILDRFMNIIFYKRAGHATEINTYRL